MRLSRARRRSAIVILLVVALVASAMPFLAVAGAANPDGTVGKVDRVGLSSVNSNLIPVFLAGRSLPPDLFSNASDGDSRFTNPSASISHPNPCASNS